MIDEIQPDLFRIEIPLPQNPLKSINSYVITSKRRNLIIDTGLNREECFRAMQTGLRELGVDLEKTDFCITHSHADHSALISRLVTENCKVYLNGPDTAFIGSGFNWDPLVRYAKINGFPEHELQLAIQNHPGNKYGPENIPEFSIIKDGDNLHVGDYRLICVETPGHSRGHTCLYDPSRKILFSGDHILIDITPNIQCLSDDINPLENYLASLDKVYELEVNLVLPGHRRLFKDHRARIKELKRHHEKRAEEVLSILDQGPKNAFQIASEMNWDIECASWDLFPASQKWFATGEALAHLRYLEERDSIFRATGAPLIRFSRNNDLGLPDAHIGASGVISKRGL